MELVKSKKESSRKGISNYKEQVKVQLWNWLEENNGNPFPTREDRIQLGIQNGLSEK